MVAKIEAKTWTAEQVRIEVSGTISLSFVRGLSGQDTFEAGLIYNKKVVDVCPCEWHEMFGILEACRNGDFRHFPEFHQRMLEEWR